LSLRRPAGRHAWRATTGYSGAYQLGRSVGSVKCGAALNTIGWPAAESCKHLFYAIDRDACCFTEGLDSRARGRTNAATQQLSPGTDRCIRGSLGRPPKALKRAETSSSQPATVSLSLLMAAYEGGGCVSLTLSSNGRSRSGGVSFRGPILPGAGVQRSGRRFRFCRIARSHESYLTT